MAEAAAAKRKPESKRERTQNYSLVQDPYQISWRERKEFGRLGRNVKRYDLNRLNVRHRFSFSFPIQYLDVKCSSDGRGGHREGARGSDREGRCGQQRDTRCL